MNSDNNPQTGAPKDPVTHPDVPDSPHPTEPEGAPDPPEEPKPYPVTDPLPEPDTEPVPERDPVPPFPEPIPGAPPDVMKVTILLYVDKLIVIVIPVIVALLLW